MGSPTNPIQPNPMPFQIKVLPLEPVLSEGDHSETHSYSEEKVEVSKQKCANSDGNNQSITT